jgi:pyridoxal phosphate enzyme (YggS family)
MYKRSSFETSQIISNYYSVLEKITAVSERIGRDPHTINLVVVTKTYDEESILPLLDIGHKNFGENRVQEAGDKWSRLFTSYPDTKLHLIGHLQTNKTKIALQIFDSIHTVDSVKLINEVQKHISHEKTKTKEFFLEINLGNEPQKHGIIVNDLKEIMLKFKNGVSFNCDGYMCIPPYNEEPALYFALLKKIALDYNIKKLSMGMSADYTKAIEFGATHVRVGSEIFGKRV